MHKSCEILFCGARGKHFLSRISSVHVVHRETKYTYNSWSQNSKHSTPKLNKVGVRNCINCIFMLPIIKSFRISVAQNGALLYNLDLITASCYGDKKHNIIVCCASKSWDLKTLSVRFFALCHFGTTLNFWDIGRQIQRVANPSPDQIANRVQKWHFIRHDLFCTHSANWCSNDFITIENLLECNI